MQDTRPPGPGGLRHRWRRLARRVRRSAPYRVVTMPGRLVRLLIARRSYNQLVVHDARFTRHLPPALLVRLLCEPNRGRFRKPDNLDIVLVHNRPGKTLMEQSLDHLGIEDYTVLRIPPHLRWRHIMKPLSILRHLRSGESKADYVLFCDSDDALMRDDPRIAIDLLHEADCDILMSSTRFVRYPGMPEVEAQTVALAPASLRKSGRAAIHLNTGVYIARTSALVDFLAEMIRYMDDDVLPGFEADVGDRDVADRPAAVPPGNSSDQHLTRYLFPRFHPAMKIDYGGRLAIR